MSDMGQMFLIRVNCVRDKSDALSDHLYFSDLLEKVRPSPGQANR